MSTYGSQLWYSGWEISLDLKTKFCLVQFLKIWLFLKEYKISGVRFAFTTICILITLYQIGLQINNYRRKDTVWQNTEEKKDNKTYSPLVIFCSEPHNYNLNSYLVYPPVKYEEFSNNRFLQIKKLKTSWKVWKRKHIIHSFVIFITLSIKGNL